MDTRQRTMRELKNLINYLRDEKGAISIKVDNIECTFLPKDEIQAKPIVDTINSIVTVKDNTKKEDDPNEVKDIYEDEDLFMSAKNE